MELSEVFTISKPPSGCVLTIGFDGVHLGHQEYSSSIEQAAKFYLLVSDF